MSTFKWSIFQLYKPIYYFSKLFGFAPFNLIKKETTNQNFQHFSTVIQCLYLLKILFFCIFIVRKYSDNIYQLILMWIELLSLSVTQFLNYFNMLIYFKRINILLIQIDQPDKYLDKISVYKSYESIKKFRNIYFIFKMILLLCTGSVLSIFPEKSQEYFNFLTFTLSDLVTEFQIIFLMYTIRTKLKCLKHMLEFKSQHYLIVIQCFEKYNRIYYNFKNSFQIIVFVKCTNSFVFTVRSVLQYAYTMAANTQELNMFFVIGWLLFFMSTPSIMCGMAVAIDHEVSKQVPSLKL